MENPFEIIIERLDKIEIILFEILKKASSESQSSNSEEFMTVEQLSDYLTLARQTIYGLCSGRELPYLKRGKRLYFNKNDIDNWLKSSKRKAKFELQEEAAEFVRKHPRKY